MYRSKRGVSLVFQGEQCSTRHKILTVESYIKWYDIYVVSPEGDVSRLPQKIHHSYRAETGQLAWSDHIPCPAFCDWIVGRYPGYEWCEASLDLIHGRWARERPEEYAWMMDCTRKEDADA